MKRVIVFILIAYFFISCVENKSVIDEIKLNDVSRLIDKDSLYEEIILDIDLHHDEIDNNIVLRSKFKELTYANYLAYQKSCYEEIQLINIYNQAESLRTNEIKDNLIYYKPKIDSTILNYRKIKETRDPSRYFKAEFSSIQKEYYSYDIESVKNLKINFKITPLKGPIHGGSFSYELIPKSTNHKVADGACRFSVYTFTDEIFTWNASYDVEKELKDTYTENISQKYDIKFTYLTVLIKDEVISALDMYTMIPTNHLIYLSTDSLSLIDYINIMEEDYNVSFTTKLDYAKMLTEDVKKRINPLAFEFEELISDH